MQKRIIAEEFQSPDSWGAKPRLFSYGLYISEEVESSVKKRIQRV